MANYRILIIDDAFFIRNLIKKAIAKKPASENTFEVAGEAQDGRAGLDLCESLKPDIITVDFNIPAINGLDFVKYLKELHPEIPIIMISSNLSSDFAAKVKEANCRLLTKPFQEAYLWKVLDEAVEEILNPAKSVKTPAINDETRKILEELADEMSAEIVPLKDTRKDISEKGLEDKNIKQEKAKNVGFDYSGEVLEIKSERRRMSADVLESEKPKPKLSYSQIDDVNLDDEDDIVIHSDDPDKNSIEELDDEEFIFLDEDEEQDSLQKVEPPVQVNMNKEEVLDFDDEDDELFLVDDGLEQPISQQKTSQDKKIDELLALVTFNYYDYLGGLLYSVQNLSQKQEVLEKDENKNEDTQAEEQVVREETADEEFERLFKEFNGGEDLHLDNPMDNEEKPVIQEEKILIRNREHVSIDPPKDDSIFKVYGSKLANVTSAETFEHLKPVEEEPLEPVKKKGFFARLLDKIFKRS